MIDRNRYAAARAGVRELQSSLEKEYPGVSLHLSESPTHLIISKIVVPKDDRGQGAGTAVMERIAAHADAIGKPIGATPSKDFGGSIGKLREFYGRFGFKPNRGRHPEISESYVRPPVATSTGPVAGGIDPAHTRSIK